MNITYNGAEIDSAIFVASCKYYDRAGGRLDRLELTMLDERQTWLRWGAAKGDVVCVQHGNLDTGSMYVTEMAMGNGRYHLSAVSAPPTIRNRGTRAWESVRLYDLLAEFADRAGMRLEVYGVQDWLYPRLEQSEVSDLGWLDHHLMLESCALKLYNGAMIVYHEPAIEAAEPVRTYDLAHGRHFALTTTSVGVYARCKVLARGHSAVFEAPGAIGPTRIAIAGQDIHTDIRSDERALRCAQGLLRQDNKREHTAVLGLPLATDMAAGAAVEIAIAGTAWPGRWLIDEARHDLIKQDTTLTLRKALEGY